MFGAARQGLYLANPAGGSGGVPQLLAVGHSTSPYLSVYENDSGTLTKIANPTDLPTNIVYGVSWNATGDILAVASVGAPELSFYEWTGSGLERMSFTAAMPGTTYAVVWNPSGTSVAVGHSSSPYITVYNWDGSTFTAISSSNFDSLPTTAVRALSWATDSQLISGSTYVGGGSSIQIWNRSGDTFTRSFATTGNDMDTIYAIARSAGSDHLAYGGSTNTSNVLNIRETVGSPWSIISGAIDTLPTNLVRGLDWNADYTSLAAAHYTSPYVSIYNRSGDSFTKITNPSTLPPGNAFGCDWSSDGSLLAVVGQGSPYMRVYSRSGDTFTAFSNPATAPTGQGWTCAWNQ